MGEITLEADHFYIFKNEENMENLTSESKVTNLSLFCNRKLYTMVSYFDPELKIFEFRIYDGFLMTERDQRYLFSEWSYKVKEEEVKWKCNKICSLQQFNIESGVEPFNLVNGCFGTQKMVMTLLINRKTQEFNTISFNDEQVLSDILVNKGVAIHTVIDLVNQYYKNINFNLN